MERTLNIPEPQVLINFPGDPAGFNWDHRVLVHKIGGGRWVVLTPDLDLEVANLATNTVRTTCTVPCTLVSRVLHL